MNNRKGEYFHTYLAIGMIILIVLGGLIFVGIKLWEKHKINELIENAPPGNPTTLNITKVIRNPNPVRIGE